MGLWDKAWDIGEGAIGRTWNIGEGLVGGIVQVPLWAVDMAKVPFYDDNEYGNFLDAIRGESMDRISKSMNYLASPESGIGAAIGAVPEPARAPVGAMFDGMQWLYDEGISQPLSTLITVGSLLDSPQWEGSFFSGDTWSTAYNIADSRSPGQAFALAIGTKDILDETEVANFMGTDFYNIASGIADLVVVFKLDPFVLIGKGAKFARSVADAGKGGLAFGMELEHGKPFFGMSTAERVARTINPKLASVRAGDRQGYLDLYFKTGEWQNFQKFTQKLADDVISENGIVGLSDDVAVGTETRKGYDLLAARLRDTVFAKKDMRTRDVDPAAYGLAKTIHDPELFQREMRFWSGDLRVIAEEQKNLRRILNERGGLLEVADEVEQHFRHRDYVIGGTTFREMPRSDLVEAVDDFVLKNMDNTDIALSMLRTGSNAYAELAYEFLDEADNFIGKAMEAKVRGLEKELGEESRKFADVNENIAQFAAGDKYQPTFTFSSTPQITLFDRAKYQVKKTDWWQKDRTSKGVRTFTDKLPSKFIDLNRSNASTQIYRLLEESPFSITEKEFYLSKFMAAEDVGQRHRAYVQIEEAIFKKIAEDHGIAPDTVHYVLNKIKSARQLAYQKVRNAVFSADDNVSVVIVEDMDEFYQLPLLKTQEANYVVTPDFRQLRRHIKTRQKKEHRFKGLYEKYADTDWFLADKARARANMLTLSEDRPAHLASYSMVGGLLNTSGDILENIMGIWAPSVLIRPAWTLRVAMLDEQIRMMGKFGGLLSFQQQLYLKKQGAKSFFAGLSQGDLFPMRGIGVSRKLTKHQQDMRSFITGAAAGFIIAGANDLTDLIPAAVGGFGMQQMVKKINRMNYAPYNLGIMPEDAAAPDGVFGPSELVEDPYFTLNSSSNSSLMNNIKTRDAEIRDRMKLIGGHEVIHPIHQERWEHAWMDVVNNQYSRDVLGRKVAQLFRRYNAEPGNIDYGMMTDDLVRWLKRDEVGREYARHHSIRMRDDESIEDWAWNVIQTMDGNLRVLGANQEYYFDDALLARVEAGLKVNAKDYIRLNDGDPRNLEPVHGAIVREVMGGEKAISRIWNRMVDDGLQLFGRLPTDHLARNPTFAAMYEMEALRLIDIASEGKGAVTLTKQSLASIRRRAKEYALNETKELLYDLSERSRFSEAARFMMPFFPAFEETLTRYVGLAFENPVWAARIHQVWGAVNKAPAFFYKDESTGDEYLRIPIPEWARGLSKHTIFGDAFNSQGEMLLPKQSFNMVTQGPGFGPLVQVPLAELGKANPELEEVLKFVMPFGPPESVVDAFLPAWVRRVESLAEGTNNRSFASAYNYILLTKMTKMQQGDIEMIDFDDPVQRAEFVRSVQAETEDFMKFRLFATVVSPSPPTFNSVYQPYIDAHRALQLKSPDKADELFLDEYGEEFFALTQSFTRSLNGIPPTIEGYNVAQNFQDLLTNFPEYGGVIVGNDAGGANKFNRYVYDKQLETALFPGSSERQREYFTPDQIISNTRTRLTWIEFSREMDQIDAMMIQRGLPNLRVKEAEPIANYKRAVIEKLSRENREWEQEYLSRDATMWTRRMEAFTAFTVDSKMSGRSDIRGLSEYLALRKQIQTVLTAQEIGRLDSTSATPIRAYWDSAVQRLVNRNPAFADLYHRYLENDPVMEG